MNQTNELTELAPHECRLCLVMAELCDLESAVEMGYLSPSEGLPGMESLAGQIESHCTINPDRAGGNVAFLLEQAGEAIERVRNRMDHANGENDGASYEAE